MKARPPPQPLSPPFPLPPASEGGGKNAKRRRAAFGGPKVFCSSFRQKRSFSVVDGGGGGGGVAYFSAFFCLTQLRLSVRPSSYEAVFPDGASSTAHHNNYLSLARWGKTLGRTSILYYSLKWPHPNGKALITCVTKWSCTAFRCRPFRALLQTTMLSCLPACLSLFIQLPKSS